MSVLVFVEHDRGDPAPHSWKALTFAREVSSDVEALIVGESGDGIADQAAAYGASVVHLAHHDLLADYGPESWGETLAQVARSAGADVVLAAGTDRGNEVIAQAAARLAEPMAANVTELDADSWQLTRIRWGGSLLERASLDGEVKLLTIDPVSVEESEQAAAGETRVFEPELTERHGRTNVTDRVVLSEGMTLATAPVVIGGGRGVGSPEGFGVLEELAELLGGVVGCSRVATNNGWRPHSDQVGQTGTKISPTVYIACGISGAIQHWVGAMGSKNIIAINTDAEANMVTKADYAVIGDLHEVLPALVETVRSAKGQ